MNTRSPVSIRLGAIVATGFLAACGGQSQDDTQIDDPGSIREIHSSITGGSLVSPLNTSWPYTATVQISASGGSSCSGLKLNAMWYLTASHCDFKTGQAVTVTNALVPSNGPSYNTTIAQAAHHPTTFSHPQLRYDLALVRLGDSNAIPTWTPGRFRAQVDNAGGRGVGYGCDLAPGSTNGGKKQWADFTTDADTDSHANVYWFKSYAIPSICAGDSGGPLYNIVNGSYYLTGITQAWNGPGNPNPVSVWARVNPAREWISAVISDLPGHNNFVHDSKGTFLSMNGSWCAEFYEFGTPGNMIQFPCKLADSLKQRFRIFSTTGGYEFRWLENSSKCLAIKGASTTVGAAVTVLPCDGSNNTRWVLAPNPIQPTYPFIQNMNSGYCMAAVSTDLFSNVTQEICVSDPALAWTFTL